MTPAGHLEEPFACVSALSTTDLLQPWPPNSPTALSLFMPCLEGHKLSIRHKSPKMNYILSISNTGRNHMSLRAITGLSPIPDVACFSSQYQALSLDPWALAALLLSQDRRQQEPLLGPLTHLL